MSKNWKPETYPEYNLRRSQLITPFGVGALIDINNQTIMIGDSAYWNASKCNKIHDVRLENAMNAVDFIEPPISEDSSIYGKTFPEWYYSPFDRLLKPISEWRRLVEKRNSNWQLDKFDRNPFDARNDLELISARIICACPEGHIQDFPWLEWPHQGMKRDEFNEHHVYLKKSDRSSKFSDYTVYCKECNSSSRLNVFNPKTFKKELQERNIKCQGRFFWKREETSKECSAELQVVMKSSTSLYFSNIISSVNIPFDNDNVLESIKNTANSDYDGLIGRILKVDESERVQAIEENSSVNNRINTICEDYELKYTTEQIKNALVSKFSPRNTDNTMMEYRREEFEVLTGQRKYKKTNDKFQIKIFNCSEFNQANIFAKLLNKITLVHQLEVVSVLRGYSRIRPTDSEQIKEMALEGNENSKSGKEVSLRRNDNRYVGMGSLGEGFFIELSAQKIKKWLIENNQSKVFEKIRKKKSQITFDDELPFIDPAYYLLHTLSHLIIRELNLNSGYSSSSLKERIYFSNDEGKNPMFGVLIYTSSSDSEGTLGGLVKQGIPENLFKILAAAIEKASWCSFDPVCIESNGQGRNSLNGAACHACALVSETSCEKMNLFLDRRVLIGDYDEPDVGFFGSLKMK